MRLLIVEDNAEICRLLSEGLTEASFAVDVVATAALARAALARARFGAVILDPGLPDAEGLSILCELRAREDKTPVLVLSARQGVQHRVQALTSGADDYLEKPFAFEELLARLEALLRRPGDVLGTSLRAGNVLLDTVARQVFVGGRAQVFSAGEVAVLEILMRRNGEVVAENPIESAIYGKSGKGGPGAVRVLVHRVRKHLIASGASVRIGTIRGSGYCLSEDQ